MEEARLPLLVEQGVGHFQVQHHLSQRLGVCPQRDLDQQRVERLGRVADPVESWSMSEESRNSVVEGRRAPGTSLRGMLFWRQRV
jgi:hypothetical protein